MYWRLSQLHWRSINDDFSIIPKHHHPDVTVQDNERFKHSRAVNLYFDNEILAEGFLSKLQKHAINYSLSHQRWKKPWIEFFSVWTSQNNTEKYIPSVFKYTLKIYLSYVALTPKKEQCVSSMDFQLRILQRNIYMSFRWNSNSNTLKKQCHTPRYPNTLNRFPVKP